MKAWLTNGRIAWEIPSGRIALRFLLGVYLPWGEWQVKRELDDDGWRRGSAGEMRKEMVVRKNV